MTHPSDPTGPAPSPRARRLGPSLSLFGLACWVGTIALYLLLRPADPPPGEAMPQGTPMRFVLAFVVASLGVFASAIISAVGLFLSLTERRGLRDSGTTRGVVLGSIGVGVLVLVVAEIIRMAFSTTVAQEVPPDFERAEAAAR
ncbi:hypothetical protein [Tautonia sociabilis]|uniref:Uncharacterized protein n=1 Tax=Tautonia sociabilis TaxID=2080755 RepID=A0A432MCX6_9BACT|nr:hypothetical protein [Tautonia sociabilis]RUL82512.1 hypothetical protein TsocGM_23460 [Tautonia sociabilis]